MTSRAEKQKAEIAKTNVGFLAEATGASYFINA
jgi:hypothetical protein